jgi:hypothetical protein
MGQSRALRAVTRALSAFGFVAAPGCGLVSGLDHLQEVACVRACGEAAGDADSAYTAPIDSTASDGAGSDNDQANPSDAIPS